MLRIGLESTNAQPAYFHEPQQNQHNADRQAFIPRRNSPRES
jgi:Zn-dependent M28 family amino/carboxypeptidase